MAKIKYIDCKDAASLNVVQDKAIKSVHSARTLIQIALVATILHIGKHGDYTSANRLVEGLGDTVNGRKIVSWLCKYGQLSINDEATGFGGLNGKFADVSAQILGTLDEAKATMWWDYGKTTNAFKGFSLEDALRTVIASHKLQLKKAEKIGDDAIKMVNVEVSSAVIQQVLQLAHFDAILADAENGDKLADEPMAEAA